MESEKIDLILHPVRLRILQAIGSETVSTQVIADRLPDIPKSSIYRHLKLLLDGGFVVIEETKQVLGTLEKYYRLSQQPHLGPEEVAGLSAADHIHYFNIFLMTLQQDFANYIESAEESSGSLDIMADLVGYTEVSF
jgi:DNA-binding transcriptional ArsR family regulator